MLLVYKCLLCLFVSLHRFVLQGFSCQASLYIWLWMNYRIGCNMVSVQVLAVLSMLQCISSRLIKRSGEEGLTSIPLDPSISSPSSPCTRPPSPHLLPSLVYCAAERSGRQTSLGCDLIKGRRVNVMNSQPITLIWAHLTCLQGAEDRLTDRESEP